MRCLGAGFGHAMTLFWVGLMAPCMLHTLVVPCFMLIYLHLSLIQCVGGVAVVEWLACVD
ncbi:hypothetical protein CsSME_00018531 [Camellia sinensis var. sinensis]